MKRRKSRGLRNLLIWIFFISLLPPLVFAEGGDEAPLALIIGETRVLDLKGLVKVAVGDPSIADVRVLSSDELLINAKGEGVTSIIIWSSEGRKTKMVEVKNKKVWDERLAAEISGAISREGVKVRVIEGVAILEGELPGNAEIERAVKIAEVYSPGRVINLLATASKSRQVGMEVRIAEVDKSYIRELGVEGPDEILSYGILNHINDIEDRLMVLTKEGRARLLANPNLVALSGHEATFLVGGEIPFPVKDEMGMNVQWKEYGVRLTIKPIIQGGDEVKGGSPGEYILSTVCTEVSTLDWTNGVKTEGQLMPAIKARSVDTTLQLMEGETLVLAGLIQSQESKNINKIPLLGDLPILGLLFKSVEFTRDQTELVIFITPYLID